MNKDGKMKLKRTTEAEKASLGDLDGQIGFLLRLAQVAVFKDLIKALKPLDLRPTDFSVLVVIGETPGLKQQQLGEALSIQRSNLVTILDQLQGRGLVQRGAVEGDRRSYALSLTSDGASLLIKAKGAHKRHVRAIATVLQGIDKGILVEGLTRLASL